MDRHLPLTASWTLHAPAEGVPAEVSGRVLPAQVPGCVHTDLMAAGLLADPYLDRNEDAQHWVGRSAWTYRTSLDDADLSAHERVDLVFEGLDTMATVLLGGTEIGSTRNMHRSYRFDVTAALAGGARDLEVRFASVYDEAERLQRELGVHPNAYPEPGNFVRKMACNFGWDWGPTLVTAGIWKPVSLHAWSTARLAQVRPLVTLVPTAERPDGRVEVHVDLERTAAARDHELLVRVDVAGRSASVTVPAGADQAVAVVEVPQPELWWPRSLGEQPLYACAVTLQTVDGEDLDAWQRRIGFRSFRIDTTGDEQRTAFTFVVNDVSVFARGVNWIPDDCFPHRVDAARYRRRLQQACEANVDLVRVWGGGLYETGDFYDACDELGLMVWQDFLFACAAYPEEEPLWSEVEAEARENVARLTPHPSLVLWNGNNENIWGFDVWHWREPLEGRSWGLGYYYDLLPSIVAEVDPTRPYWAGSPWSGSADLPPNDPDHGCIHIWDVWNGRDYTGYRDYAPPFVSEFGWQAPPAWATLREAVSDRPFSPDSPGVVAHQKAKFGQENLLRGLADHFGEGFDADDWHHLTQVNQARAIQLGVEHWRSRWPSVAGAIVWQLNDCWPVISWAAVDGAERRKPLWYALRRAFADRLVTVQPREGRLVAAVVNQSDEPWETTLSVERHGFDGSLLDALVAPVVVAPHSVLEHELPAALAAPADVTSEVLVATAGEQRGLWFFAEDRDLAYVAEPLVAQAVPEAGGYRVHIEATSVVRDLVLHADRLAPDAEVDDACLTLLPGEVVELHVRTRAELDLSALVAEPVLATVNAAVLRSRAALADQAAAGVGA
ncbi:MAG: glycoside hydrolase family 2 protein [Motilibacteraceae bacterium]